MIYQEITKSMFHDAFRNYDRLDNFSYEARNALYDYINEIEDMGDGIELDIISLCCEFNEDTIENTLKEYNLDSLEELNNETIVIWDDSKRVLYQAF